MPPPNWKYRLGKGFEGFVRNCLLIRLFRKQSYFEGSETVQSLCKNDKNGSSYCSNIVKILKHKLDCFAYARNDDLCAKHTEKDLFSYLPIHLFTFRKAAFTLAEVLITLGIIGVVAALTLPTLIANHQKQTLVNQLKKAVNTIENAAQSATAEEGVSSFHDTLFKCFISDGYLCGTTWKDEYKEAGNKYLKTISLAVPYDSENVISYKDLYGNVYPLRYDHKTVLNDGAIIYADCSYIFYVDVNGEKGPNVLGRDFFVLAIDAYGHVIDSFDTYQDYTTYYNRGEKIINSHKCEKDNIDPAVDGGCYYYKIVADGWKMNY